jgi:2-succinyl-5-enolpyruvyl-6-hydroxy-3-cyclohexene-1-carboxylate synthase
MGVAAKTIDSITELKAELTEPVNGILVVVVNVPDRDANADQLKGIYSGIASM